MANKNTKTIEDTVEQLSYKNKPSILLLRHTLFYVYTPARV